MALSKRSTTASSISSGCKFRGGKVKRRYLRYRRFVHSSCKRRTDRSSSARTIGSAGWSPARASRERWTAAGGGSSLLTRYSPKARGGGIDPFQTPVAPPRPKKPEEERRASTPSPPRE